RHYTGHHRRAVASTTSSSSHHAPREEATLMARPAPSHGEPRTFVKNVHGVRYQVKAVARAIAFYTNHLGFNLERQQLPAFANVSLGDAQILLSGPGAS